MPCITYETAAEREESARQYRNKLTKPLQQEIDNLKTQLAEREVMLCAVLRIYDPDGLQAVFAEIDWTEAGIVQADMESWWAKHQERDCLRREQEAAEQTAQREQALAKLTAEERKLLGL